MSNNIYDILKKMQGLEAPKQNLTEGKKAKPDFADLDKDGDKKEPMKKAAKEKAKGAIAEAVARVEKNLAEKYMSFKKLDEERKEIPVGVIDGPGGYEEAQKRIKDYEAGKINKDGKQLPPIEDRSKPADKPKTKAVDESGLQAYLGKKKYGEQGMKALQKAGRDGASKEKMAKIRARHDKMDEGDQLPAPPDEVHLPKKGSKHGPVDVYRPKKGMEEDVAEGRYIASTGQSHRDLESFMSGDDRHEKQPRTRDQLQPDRELDPTDTTTWRGPKKHIQRRQATGGIRGPRGPLPEGEYNEDMLSPGQKKIAKMSPPPGKIDANDLAALRAGKKKKAEGNAFSGAVAKAKATGQDEFNVGGKEYKVQEGWDDMMKAAKERSGPQPSGGSGIKQGTRYGGGRQTDEPDTDNETGEVAKKGRGRPKKDKFAK